MTSRITPVVISQTSQWPVPENSSIVHYCICKQTQYVS